MGGPFSHPKDFTPVCTTELASLARLHPQFTARGAKVIGLSVDTVSSHRKWVKQVESALGHQIDFPIIGDPDLKVATLYDMLPEAGDGPEEEQSASANTTVRSVLVIGPDKRVKAALTYPPNTGRNFDEVLRILDSCQLTARYEVATPANWHHGEDVIILPDLPEVDARQRFPEGWRSSLPYLRVVPDPSFGSAWFESLQRH